MCDSVNKILKAQFVTASGNMDNLSENALELAITVLHNSVNCDQTGRQMFAVFELLVKIKLLFSQLFCEDAHMYFILLIYFTCIHPKASIHI